ncbi:MAG: ABC transporter substrate-binding protein, partial [Dehalococcoidia bacterium]|nr:ABC transporter substrate-binding protein [Dehalococcoidia bacterium]
MNISYVRRYFHKTAMLGIGLSALMMAFILACGGDPETIVVEKEVIKEVPVEKIVTQEVVKTIEVPGETVVKEVVKTVEVPGETVVKEVVIEVPVEKIVTQEVVKTVEIEVPVEVIKEVVKTVEVPVPEIMSYNESPALAQQVAAGLLPPVDERLPKEPWVIPAQEIGTYGGTLHRAYLGYSDIWNWLRLSRAPVARWTTDGSGAIPAVVKKWDISDGGKKFTFQLREGMRWSDGVPVTMEDVRFAWEDVIGNEEINSSPSPIITVEGQLPELEIIDDWTFSLTFHKPNYTFVKALPQAGFGWVRFILPAHWAKQFHGDYADADSLAALLQQDDLDTWSDLFDRHVNGYYREDINQPTLHPWVLKGTWGDQRVVAERNPYFWAVDSAGNQLPYIDRLVYDLAENGEVIQLRAIAGELEVQGRHIKLTSYPTLQENREKGDYSVKLWPEYGGSNVVLWFNQTWEGPEVEYFPNPDFRRALSVAADRNTINEVSFLGVATPRNYMPSPGHPHHPGPEYDTLWTQYDPEMANQMLDSVGLDQKDGEGFRLMSNGERMVLSIIMFEGYADWADATEQVIADWEEVGIKATMRIGTRSNIGQEWQSNQGMIYNHPMDTAGFTFAEAGPKTSFAYGLVSPKWRD